MEQIKLNLGGRGEKDPAETIGDDVLRTPYGMQPHIQRIMSRVHAGSSLARYKIIDIIGIGSHGIVYKAVDKADKNMAFAVSSLFLISSSFLT